MPPLKELDPEIEDRTVAAVIEDANGWNVFTHTLDGGSAMMWVSGNKVRPRVGDRLRVYGTHPIRGLDVNGQEIYYRPPAGWEDLLDLS